MNNKTVGVFHPFPSNRSVLIEELENDEMNFMCEEITEISKLNDANSEVIVVFSLAFLTNRLSESEIRELMMETDKTLIIVEYDVNVWKMDRPNTFYLVQKNNRETMINVKTVLIMELMGRRDNTLLDTEKLPE